MPPLCDGNCSRHVIGRQMESQGGRAAVTARHAQRALGVFLSCKAYRAWQQLRKHSARKKLHERCEEVCGEGGKPPHAELPLPPPHGILPALPAGPAPAGDAGSGRHSSRGSGIQPERKRAQSGSWHFCA